MDRLRVEYEVAGIDPDELSADPFDEFGLWFTAAVDAGVEQANSFVLATSTSRGVPSARAVLLKQYGPNGFIFFTNRASRKGTELSENPVAAGCFVWLPLHRQVRLEGRVEMTDPDMADAYFNSRPDGSRVASAASPQSSVVPSRAHLEALYAEVANRHPDGNVARPDTWVGYRIIPTIFEFWQGRPDRFHDRVRYRIEDGEWVKERLAP